MARIGGRSSWLAWPAGLLCAAVVVALAWLSQPMIPVTVAWVGEMFHAATNQPRPAADPERVSVTVAEPGQLDCRTMYPDDLWTELTWTPKVLLSQTMAPPATTVESLNDALAPAVRVTCSWRADGGRAIASTLATVAADATPIAEAALRGQGFTCQADAGQLTCSRTASGVLEEHVVREGVWLSSVESGWHPDEYGTRLAAHVWG